jgi:hypothetical protein
MDNRVVALGIPETAPSSIKRSSAGATMPPSLVDLIRTSLSPLVLILRMPVGATLNPSRQPLPEAYDH